MKKRKEDDSSKHQFLINQLLTLFFSGIYITTSDLLSIAKKLGFEMPSKSREIILKNLFAQSEKERKSSLLYDELITLLQTRVLKYREITTSFPSIQSVSGQWARKSNTIIRLLQQEKRGNPYE